MAAAAAAGSGQRARLRLRCCGDSARVVVKTARS